MRFVSEEALAAVAGEYDARRPTLDRYRNELVDDPVAGWCLRNYIILTEFPEVLGDARLTEADVYWNRYYWLARYAKAWKVVDPEGYDPAVEEQLADMLADDAPHDDDTWPLTRIEEAAERDAERHLRAAGLRRE